MIIEKEAVSPSSSATSATEVYMDAVDILSEGQSGKYAILIRRIFCF